MENVSSKYHKRSEPRLCLTMESKIPEETQKITDGKKIREIVKQNLAQDCYFVTHPDAKISGVYPKDTQETGYLFVEFTLFGILKWCGLGEADQDKIWKSFDLLSSRRKIKIFDLRISPILSHLDISGRAEIGRALREYTICGPQIVHLVYYWDRGKALSQKDFLVGGRTILKPSQKVTLLRNDMHKHFKNAFGWSNEAEIEKRLYREKISEEAQLKAAIEKVARNLK